MSTPWSALEIKQYYDNYSIVYDKEVENCPEEYVSAKKMSSLLDKYLVKQAKQLPYKILDVGCGTGLSSEIFLSSTKEGQFKVIGIDLSEGMLEKAKEKGLNNFVIGDISSDKFWNEAFTESEFDAVICVGVFDFISSTFELLNAIHRKLKRKIGLLSFTIPLNAAPNEELLREPVDVIYEILNIGYKIIHMEQFLGYVASENAAKINFLGIVCQVQ